MEGREVSRSPEDQGSSEVWEWNDSGKYRFHVELELPHKAICHRGILRG